MKQRRCKCLWCERPFTQVRVEGGDYPKNCPHCEGTSFLFNEEVNL